MSDDFYTQAVEPSTPESTSENGSFSVWGALQTIVAVAILMASLFTLWTPSNLFSNALLEQMVVSFQRSTVVANTTPVAPVNRLRIGLVVGHSGYDPGASCPDGLTELDVNRKIANLTSRRLAALGYDIDLLDEFDPRLTGYQAMALVSIHNDSCNAYVPVKTGFKVAPASSQTNSDKSQRLAACLTDRYRTATGLSFDANTVTRDMTEYHAFTEIHGYTAAAIIETGFLNEDRNILVNQTDKVAEGVAAGIVCYIRNESINQQPTPTP
jgi:N-acetylmuramoyl-L-alanine amidase